ncbi:RCC1 repeat-containing protein [Beauveria bassiana]|nr:RCC1 repeat-containing protein [Beauveria bassiana]
MSAQIKEATPDMELFAAGCNAWAQLEFDTFLPSDSDDVTEFTKIAVGQTLQKPVSRLAYTLIQNDDKFLIAGYFPDPTMAPRAASFVMRANGDSLRPIGSSVFEILISKGGAVNTDKMCAQKPVKQIAALDTAFVLLYEDGTVATMGDARFPHVLGRMISEDEPAEELFTLLDLDTLGDPVQHITACGYTAAALTKSGSVYIWGQHPQSRAKELPFFPGLSRFPNYTEIGGGKDIADIALGETHGIALTKQGDVYVIGNNESGQLGIPSVMSVRTWTKLEFSPPQNAVVTGVAAGPHTSFMLISSSLAAN